MLHRLSNTYPLLTFLILRLGLDPMALVAVLDDHTRLEPEIYQTGRH